MDTTYRAIRLLPILLLWGCILLGGQNSYAGKRESAVVDPPLVEVAKPQRINLGGFSIVAGYNRYSWPVSYGYWPRYYEPYYPYFSPYSYPTAFFWPLHSGWSSGFAYQEGMGEIRLRTNVDQANVFLDEAWAGMAKDLKTIWLHPGVYNLRIASEKCAPFQIRLYVLSGKTLKVNAQLAPSMEISKP